MNLALKEARNSLDKNEVPIGSIIVHKNKVISVGHNSPISQLDPTAHAEINAIRNAAKKIENYRMPDMTIFTTLEPCYMCFGAISHARISRIVFGAYNKKIKSKSLYFLNKKIQITGGILEKDCSKILLDFFKEKRL